MENKISQKDEEALFEKIREAEDILESNKTKVSGDKEVLSESLIFALGVKEGLDKIHSEEERDWFIKDSCIQLKRMDKKEPESFKRILTSRFTPKPYAEEVMKYTKFLHDKHGRFWRFDNELGVWREDAVKYIRNILREKIMGEEEQKKLYVEEVTSYIKDLTWTDKDPNFLPLRYIPFNNCMYDLKDKKTVPFSPEFFITTKIPISLNGGDVECPAIMKFLKEVVPDHSVLLDLMAYCMYRSYPYQKLFILFGAGANGKSIFMELLRQLIGDCNISTEDPHELITNRFSKGMMWNKMANVSNDMSYSALKNTNILKQLTGSDWLNCERKYKEPFSFKNYAKQIYSTNQIPASPDKTNAWYRRIYLIEFPRTFKEDADRRLIEKLTTPEEMKGLAHVLIGRLIGFIERGCVFDNDPDEEEMGKLYETLSNPLTAFLEEFTVEDYKSFIYKYEFRDSFISYLQKRRLRVWNEGEIGSEMKKQYRDGQRGEKQYRAWAGVRWKGELSDFSTPVSKSLPNTHLPLQTQGKTKEYHCIEKSLKRGVFGVDGVYEDKKTEKSMTKTSHSYLLQLIKDNGGEVKSVLIDENFPKEDINNALKQGLIMENPAGKYRLVK